MSDEGGTLVRLVLYDEHGRQGAIAVPRQGLLRYAKLLLDAGLRTT